MSLIINKMDNINLYRPLVYVTALLIILFQFYVIWEQKIGIEGKTSYINYSYSSSSKCGREMDWGFVTIKDHFGVPKPLNTTDDIVYAIDEIEKRTKRKGVALHSWQNLRISENVLVK